MKFRLVFKLGILGAFFVSSVFPMQLGTTERVSVSSSGAQGNNSSTGATISADGRFVAFKSDASNLVSGDTNGSTDVFVHDRQTGKTTRVSVSSSGAQGNGGIGLEPSPSISADGRFVAFDSEASNLVSGDTNGANDVFVHDRQTGKTTRISVSSSGSQGNSYSDSPSISADGRYVAFESYASNLVSGDTNGTDDVFVHDRQTGKTTLVSVSSSGAQGDYWSQEPSISADGRYVAFSSLASNLVSGDTNGTSDVFVHDRQTGKTTRVSVSSSWREGNGHSNNPSISADGRYVAFTSDASNLVSGDTNGTDDVFVHDRQTGKTTRVSVSSSGAQGNSWSEDSSISADGRYIAFESEASNLVSGDSNGYLDVFVHDRQIGQTTLVSVSSSGAQGNNWSDWPSISMDGRYVAFGSDASNLVSGDTNGYQDVFVHGAVYKGGDIPPPTISILSTYIAKDSYTGNFTIYVSTSYTLYTSTGSATVTLGGITDEQGQILSDTKTVYFGGPPVEWKFDLEQRNVPRFTKPMNISVKATITDEKGSTGSAMKLGLHINIPVVIVRGIKIFPWGSWTDQKFINGMLAHGYELEGDATYPTLFPLAGDYLPDKQTLVQSADVLAQEVNRITSDDGPTYAAKVDIVAHSKGGLVSRMYVSLFGPSKMRRLILAAVPNTGAVMAHQLPETDPYIELLPTHDWYRVFIWENFYQKPENTTLKLLNQIPMPSGLEYYLLWGYGWNTYANFTASTIWYEFNNGDKYVLSWSQMGYEVVNYINGSSDMGELIKAFDPVFGAEPPKQSIGLPYSHTGFLGKAVDEIYSILSKP
ncbi:MAG TPA: hypothetical protein VNK96_10315 [Fimbriimonadales bacterium]|nr:hypothetical protein [Fimbriimonadales bacterium]